MPITSSIGPYTRFGKEKYLYFAGNNYLNIAGRSELITGAKDALHNYGTSFGASRTTTGTSDLHLELERTLAHFKDTEEAVIYPSGYLGNQILLSALLNSEDSVIYDGWAHPSILEGIPKDIVNIHSYRHNDLNDLSETINTVESGEVLVNGLDPITGEIAPLDEIVKITEDSPGRLRLTLSAGHTKEDIEHLCDMLKNSL